MTIQNQAIEITGSHFDYTHQAWTLNGRYVRCGHPKGMECGCYGRVHEGELANVMDLPTAGQDGGEIPEHSKDSDCIVDPRTDLCTVCGVMHGEPCPDCGGKGFHTSACTGSN
jgi:hypothetical protein